MSNPSLQRVPPASQTLEDMACAYWGSDTLFAALELNLFGVLGKNTLPLPELARIAHCHPEPLSRLLTALSHLNLVRENNYGWQNQPASIHHLVPGEPEYFGDFLLYRRYLQPTWQTLANNIAINPLPPLLNHDDDYPTRTSYYVRALDQLARLKAKEIRSELSHISWRGPILDIGGGAGALSRALIQEHPQQAKHATVFDLPEVIYAAQALYPDINDWQNTTTLSDEYRNHHFADNQRFGLIMFANFLHIYNEVDTQECLNKAADRLVSSGHLLIHDYCPDRGNVKGSLYDLNMMINTPEGRCHNSSNLLKWLTSAGFQEFQVIDLPSDSTLIIARRSSC